VFCSDRKLPGGGNIRNIEVHNKDVLKASSFTIRPELSEGMDQFGINFMENLVRTQPGFYADWRKRYEH